MEKNKMYLVYAVGPFENTGIIDDLTFDGYDPSKDTRDYVVLYAFTYKKSTLKKFMAYRNRDRFQIRKRDISELSDVELNEFLGEYRNRMINDKCILSTPAYNVKLDKKERTESGLIDLNIPLTAFEENYLGYMIEATDDKIAEDFNDEIVRCISMIMKSAKPDLLEALISSGIFDIMGYIETIVNGETNIDYTVGLDEVYCLLEYYGELFKF